MTNAFGRLVAAFAAVVSIGAPARAQTYGFGYSGTIQYWTAPTTATYFISAIGAQGGHGTFDNGPYVGGRGASIGGRFSLTIGDILALAVGGAGSSFVGSYSGGGGGGSFVVDGFGNALLIAGGGGGIRSGGGQNGSDASLTGYAKQGSGFNQTYPDITKTTGLGQGGVVTWGTNGGGGAGFFSDGAIDIAGSGKDWANGLAGGVGNYTNVNGAYCSSAGGFGGGGSGTGCGGGGGGGGYSGGDGGNIAGGGGSYNLGEDQIGIAGVGYGNGYISVTTLPEPASLTLMLTGLGGVGVSLQRRKRKNARA